MVRTKKESTKPSEAISTTVPQVVSTEDFLKPIVQDLSTQTEKAFEDIMKELTKLINEGFTAMGAVVKWKSANKNLLGTKIEMEVRVIGKDAIRTATLSENKAQKVTNVSFLVLNSDSTFDVRDVTLWGDRTEMAEEFTLGNVYIVKAKEGQGRLTYMTKIKEVPEEEAKIPTLADLPGKGVQFAKPGNIIDYIGKSDLFHGWVGKLIRDKTSGVVIGFELSDAESFPATVWVSSKSGPMPEDLKAAVQKITDGDEVLVYGYVSQGKSQGDPRINGKGVFKVG